MTVLRKSGDDRDIPPKKPAKELPPAIRVPYLKLVALLGKPVDDPAVQEVLAKAGKVKLDKDFVIAKEAGFDYALDKPPGAKKKVMSTLFLFSHGSEGHAGFADLPKPLAFTDRATLRKARRPDGSWTIDDGDVEPEESPEAKRDRWDINGYEVSADYNSEGFARHFNVTDANEARDLSTHPLHFETKPVDAPKDAEYVGMALIAAWSATRFGLPSKHANTEAGTKLVARSISPVTFLKAACSKTLSTHDVVPELGDFLYDYTNRLFLGTRAPNRKETAAALKKILNLAKADEREYGDDFRGTFKGVVKNPFNVPDSWAAVDRIAPILDARWADYQATKMKEAPDLAMYEKAAAKRDAVALTGASAAVATVTAIDAKDLLSMIGKPIKEVKDILTRAGLPIGKRIDEQATPATGVSYMGSNLEVGGKKQLCVTAVSFYANKTSSYIRGIGKEVEFVGYPGPVALGVTLGTKRADVAKAWGAPNGTSDKYDYWYPDKKHRISAEFAGGKLSTVYIGLVEEWQGKPKPPFGPKGIVG